MKETRNNESVFWDLTFTVVEDNESHSLIVMCLCVQKLLTQNLLTHSNNILYISFLSLLLFSFSVSIAYTHFCIKPFCLIYSIILRLIFLFIFLCVSVFKLNTVWYLHLHTDCILSYMFMHMRLAYDSQYSIYGGTSAQTTATPFLRHSTWTHQLRNASISSVSPLLGRITKVWVSLNCHRGQFYCSKDARS